MRGTIIKRGDSYRIKVSLGKNNKTGKYESHFEMFFASRNSPLLQNIFPSAGGEN